MNDFDLIESINKKTCSKYSFLRLKQVFFDVNRNMCQISLIYPEICNLSDNDKDKIIETVKEILDLKETLYVIKISKSFVEEDLIRQTILKFLQENCPVFYNGVIEGCLNPFGEENGGNLKIDIQTLNEQTKNVQVTFSCENDMYNYFVNGKLDKKIVAFLNCNFCANFSIFVERYNSKPIDETLLAGRLEELKTKSDIEALVKQNENKFLVANRQKILGEEINFNPRFIKTIKEEMENCVIAGKINFLKERTFKAKSRKKNKETGEVEVYDKPYFNFQIKDDSGFLNVVVFPNKEGYHKMHLLKDGDTIIAQGKIEKFNDKFEMMARRISFCEIPNKNEVNSQQSNFENNTYKFVKPIKYTSLRQSNLFESEKMYSNEVKNQSYIVYDFETTGVDTNKDEIVEIGALKIVNGEFREVFTTLVKPKKQIPFEATKINRISNDMVEHSPSIEQVIGDFFLFCKDCQMVGYNNIAFDSIFLTNAGKKANIDFNNGQIDAFLLAKQKLKGLKNYKLGTVSDFLKVNLIDAHRALNDVIATAEVFLKLY